MPSGEMDARYERTPLQPNDDLDQDGESQELSEQSMVVKEQETQTVQEQEMTPIKSAGNHGEGEETQQERTTAKGAAPTKLQVFMARKVCGCGMPVFLSFVGLVSLALIIGVSVSASNQTGAFKPVIEQVSEELYFGNCFPAKLTNGTQWNLQYKSYAFVPDLDPEASISAEVNLTKQFGLFIEFTNKDGFKLVERFHVKGVSWSGFETAKNLAGGFESTSADAIFDLLVKNGFNAIRIPFHMKMLDGVVKPDSKVKYPKSNIRWATSSSISSMETLVMQAANRGLLVVLDFHSFGPDSREAISITPEITEYHFGEAWKSVASRFRKYWNVIGADIKNEIYNGTWGGWIWEADIKGFQERIGQKILEVAPNWVLFVQGSWKVPDSATLPFPGGNLIGAREQPFGFFEGKAVIPDDKYFYFPHVFGPGYFNQSYFQIQRYGDFMAPIWRSHWGYLAEEQLGAVMIGAYGTSVFPDDPDTQAHQDQWSDSFAQYLENIQSQDAFYWVLNPNVKGVSGLFQEDWITPQQITLDFAAKVQPNPSAMRYFPRTQKFCTATR